MDFERLDYGHVARSLDWNVPSSDPGQSSHFSKALREDDG